MAHMHACMVHTTVAFYGRKVTPVRIAEADSPIGGFGGGGVRGA